MTIQDGQFDIDAVYAGDLYITLECQHCAYCGEMGVPIDVAEVLRRAAEHQEVCDGKE